jgi:hypothetical protein
MIDKDFLGVFDNMADESYCKKVIEQFERVKTISRIEKENISPVHKDDKMYFMINETDSVVMDANQIILEGFIEAVSKALDEYSKQYPILIGGVAKYDINNDVKIQRTLPGQGYHVWHCENGRKNESRRMIVAFMYLNKCEQGGETEFLYQHRRIKPEAGRLVLAPTGWTHPHRGNPPLKGVKYMITGWLEYQL